MSAPERPAVPGGPQVSVMVCRDCCCGSATKHPRTDHRLQRDRLLALASPDVRVRVVDCLDECTRSNVVLVRDLTRPREERDTWLGGVLTTTQTEALAGWIEDRGPLPEALAGADFTHRPPVAPVRQTTRFGPPPGWDPGTP